MDSPIATLTPEILLKVFELLDQDDDVALLPAILCCRKWCPLVKPILYGDVFLNARRLTRFLDAYTDRQIRSRTLAMDPIQRNPYDGTFPMETLSIRLKALQRLSLHIKKMGLISLSITINFPFPFTASFELSSIIHNLPDSCTCLEIDTAHNCPSFPDPGTVVDAQPTSHMCDAISTILPQLEHLRLRRPRLCSALFGTESHEQDRGFKAVRAPKLKSCLISLSLREPTASNDPITRAAQCDSTPLPFIDVRPHYPPALPPLLPRRRDFTYLNSASLERLWIIDVHPRDPTIPNSWAAWVRLDILLDTSSPIPMANIGAFRKDCWLARIPTDLRPAEDYISTPKCLEELAEGRFWSTTTRGIHLATPILREYDCISRPLTRELAQQTGHVHKNRRYCVLWDNEEATGERLLPEGPGPLMEVWDLKERTPEGWTRDNHQGTPLVRKRDILIESL